MNDSSLTLLIIVQRVIVYAEASSGHLILKNVRHSLTWSIDVSSFTHSPIHSFIHSFIYSFIHSLTLVGKVAQGNQQIHKKMLPL